MFQHSGRYEYIARWDWVLNVMDNRLKVDFHCQRFFFFLQINKVALAVFTLNGKSCCMLQWLYVCYVTFASISWFTSTYTDTHTHPGKMYKVPFKRGCDGVLHGPVTNHVTLIKKNVQLLLVCSRMGAVAYTIDHHVIDKTNPHNPSSLIPKAISRITNGPAISF